ncbi:beta-lactamase family protein [Streptomyces sp. NBC_00654]|uniref:serine hydrolase domain-containing protein n=1 Tax=Streptomyces sp. NBC_00654 TaxID=2975799 RepID=UPI002251AE40|nr:serine hydrolase domain-containing protein [Streptomyces sp. NBC_00654]MCX4969310.1 beta-lactamase family protein [Streptomyces sp. NBC_00654]
MREQARQKFRSSGRRQRGGRRGAVSAAAAVVVGVMTVGVLAPPAAFAASRPDAPGPDAVQQDLNALVNTHGMPAALASVTDRAGHHRTYTAGVGDLATGAAVPRDGQVRVGSNTKTFTAAVVLQLVAEGRIRLGDRVETYLPGLVRGDGIDGRRITVRQLLQHTSGLPNYTDYDIQPRYYDPRELVGIALQHKAEFAPGKSWKYSNTNYVLAGLIIQKVTGRPLAEELDRRIIKPLGLRHTYFPAPGDVTIREPHPKGYYPLSEGAPLTDFTETDPSWGWAAGQLISTNSDLNRFFSALLDGRLLPKAQLAQMRTNTRPAETTFGAGARYGLGLMSKPLSCGGVYWGHGGSFPGYETRGGVTREGRAVNIAVTTQPTAEADKALEKAVDTALCG